jgi:mRNA-degrading endonuclease YafQ of YafQ-DinJ toxin-antitoxin module
MILVLTERFRRDHDRLTLETQIRVEQALRLLQTNPHHPSLHVKKMKGISNVWEARETRSHRLTFQIQGETLIMRRVGSHDVEENP